VSTRPLWLVLGTLWEVLIIAFGLGVWASAGGKRTLRVAGGLLVAYGLLGLMWPFASMHQRQVLAAGGATFADTAHLVLVTVGSLLMFAAMAFAAAAFGMRFRLYSIATIVILLAFGVLTSLDAPRVQANLPTPWAGLWERINIVAFLVWIIVLAVVLFRTRVEPAMSDVRHAIQGPGLSARPAG
jgi:accessory gene regulator protein AgrB